MARRADAVERTQLESGETLLGHAGELLIDDRTTAAEPRFLGSCLREALRDALRVAHSRGGRLGRT
ncbi:hypothetical protein [Streptomyces sp. NPDC020742]|uniref:hypothetical protein n=1 Tax=Streptomyces sp. NPDC020742 TaxID=3154897 RepID=UPI0033FD37CA